MYTIVDKIKICLGYFRVPLPTIHTRNLYSVSSNLCSTFRRCLIQTNLWKKCNLNWWKGRYYRFSLEKFTGTKTDILRDLYICNVKCLRHFFIRKSLGTHPTFFRRYHPGPFISFATQNLRSVLLFLAVYWNLIS